MAKTESQKITKEFEFPLTEKDRSNKLDELAALHGEVEELEVELSEVTGALKFKIKERYELASKIAKTVRDGKETRAAEADMIKDYPAASVRFMVDGVMVEERAMTPEELQLPLPEMPKKKTKTADDGRLEDAAKAEATKKKTKVVQLHPMEEHIREETGRKTKRSSVDGVYT